MKKKDFMLYMKTFIKNILNDLEENKVNAEEIKKFKDESKNFMTFLIKNFDNIVLYYNEKAHTCKYGHLGIAVYVDPSDPTPTFFYIKHALKEVKC